MGKSVIRVFHTNDIHCKDGGMLKIANFIMENKGENDLYLDSGDLTDLGEILTQGSNGEAPFLFMKEAGLDAITVGNGEVDLAHDNLARCSQLGIPVVSCNIRDNEGNEVGDIKKSIIISRLGIRFLIIGISPYYDKCMKPNGYNDFTVMFNLQTAEPIKEIENELKKQEGAYDYCICISHCGINVDEYLMERFPQIDYWLGGHSHSLSTRDGYIQSGKYGNFVGVVQLIVQDGKIVKTENEVLQLAECENIKNPFEAKIRKFEENVTESFDIKRQYESLHGKAEQKLDEILYEIEPVDHSYTKENTLTNFIAEAMYRDYTCDFAFVNAGIVEGAIDGRVSKLSLLKLSPSKLNPTRFKVLGKNIRTAIHLSLDEEYCMGSGEGAGVRGSKIRGTLGFSSNVLVYKDSEEIFIDGVRLDDNREYICVANDALQRGTGYPSLKSPNEGAEFFDGFIRDLLERTLQDNTLMNNAKIKRIK